jgi:predicted phage terminase large subunit-like protein
MTQVDVEGLFGVGSVDDGLPITEETIRHFIWKHKYFPDLDNPNAKFHYKMVQHLQSATPEDNTRCVRAFRGSAKSSTACFLALHRCEYPNAFFTMVVSATATLAEGLISDIKNMVLSSNLPYTIVRAVSNEIQIRFKGKDYYILGVGSGAALRGTKRGGRRADLILTDDLMTMEISQNKVRRDRLIRWYYSDLRPSIDPVVGVLWSVGTPMVQGDLFDILTSNNPTLDIPLTYDSWSDRFSREYIDRTKEEYRSIGMINEYKREFELVMVDSENSVFDISKVVTIQPNEAPSDLSYFCTLDGAFSERDAADYSAFTVLGIDSKGKWYVWSYALKDNPQEVIAKLFDLHRQFGFYTVGIEKGQFLLSMKVEIDRLQIDNQQYFSIQELSTTGSKIARIKALAPVINSRRLTVVDTGEAAEALVEQIELTSNEACLATHDDHIDSLCQLLQMDLYYNEDSNVEYTREDYYYEEPSNDLWSDDDEN